MDVPRDVMQGYTVMAAEAAGQLRDDGPPSHLFLQTGVGGMAAAVAAQFWQTLGSQRPAVAGLAGLIAVAADPQGRRGLGLSARSRVLLIGTEGDTDPAVYQAIVGRSAATVRAP